MHKSLAPYAFTPTPTVHPKWCKLLTMYISPSIFFKALTLVLFSGV